MAYNYMFPANYQPQQAYYPQNNPSTGITWVQGEAGAKSYLVAPNNTVALWDSESQAVYLKSADASGMPSMKILDYTIRDESPHKLVSERYTEFATKDDVDSIWKAIEALRGDNVKGE